MRNILIAVLCFLSAITLAQEVNSKVTFNKRVTFKDSILIPASSGAGKVLTSDANGYGRWVNNSGWALLGNSGTNPNVNFIGTTDAVGLYFKSYGTKSGMIEDNAVTSFGYNSMGNLGSFGDAPANTAFGSTSLLHLEAGNNNVAFGDGALNSLRNGQFNTSIGSVSGQHITENNFNTVIGGGADVLDSNVHYAIALGGNAIAASHQFAITDSIIQVYFNLNSGASGSVLTNNGNGVGTWQTPRFVSGDSATIYALTPTVGTTYYCTNCTGDGITGRIVSYIGAAWRRLKFD